MAAERKQSYIGRHAPCFSKNSSFSGVLLDLFVAMLGENLEEVTYAAGVAQLR